MEVAVDGGGGSSSKSASERKTSEVAERVRFRPPDGGAERGSSCCNRDGEAVQQHDRTRRELTVEYVQIHDSKIVGKDAGYV